MRWRCRNSAVANRLALHFDYYSTTKKTAVSFNEAYTPRLAARQNATRRILSRCNQDIADQRANLLSFKILKCRKCRKNGHFRTCGGRRKVRGLMRKSRVSHARSRQKLRADRALYHVEYFFHNEGRKAGCSEPKRSHSGESASTDSGTAAWRADNGALRTPTWRENFCVQLAASQGSTGTVIAETTRPGVSAEQRREVRIHHTVA